MRSVTGDDAEDQPADGWFAFRALPGPAEDRNFGAEDHGKMGWIGLRMV